MSDLKNFNEIFRKDETYDNNKSYKKAELHVSEKYIFWTKAGNQTKEEIKFILSPPPPPHPSKDFLELKADVFFFSGVFSKRLFWKTPRFEVFS